MAKANAWQPSSTGPPAQAFKSEAARAKARQSPASTGPPAQAGTSVGPGNDPKSLSILAKLEEPIAMSFPTETPLEDLLKYIKQATTGPTYAGIPIYVDPLGMQEAERTLTSPISLDLEGIPLRRTLQLALKQLGLGYFVDDGILVITSQESGDQGGLEPAQIGPSPFLKKQDRMERGEMTIEEMKEFAEELKVKTEIMKQLKELRNLESMGGGMGGQAVKTDQVAAILKEMKALVDEIKVERDKGKKDGSK